MPTKSSAITRQAKKDLALSYTKLDESITIRQVMRLIWKCYRPTSCEADDAERGRIALHNACLEELVLGLDKFIRVQIRDKKLPPENRRPWGRPRKETVDSKSVKKRKYHPRFVASYYWNRGK